MRKQKGAILVEFAFAFPVLVLFMLGGIDLTRLVNAKSDLDAITITTANCYVANTCGDDPQGFAQGMAHGFLMAPSATTMSCSGSSCTGGYTWLPISPFFSQTQLRISAVSK